MITVCVIVLLEYQGHALCRVSLTMSAVACFLNLPRAASTGEIIYLQNSRRAELLTRVLKAPLSVSTQLIDNSNVRALSNDTVDTLRCKLFQLNRSACFFFHSRERVSKCKCIEVSPLF